MSLTPVAIGQKNILPKQQSRRIAKHFADFSFCKSEKRAHSLTLFCVRKFFIQKL